MVYPAVVIVEPSQLAALALVEAGGISYAAFCTPLPSIVEHASCIVRCDVLKLGDVVFSLHIQCGALKAVDFSVFGVSLHAAYFAQAHTGVYTVIMPVCLLNVPAEDIVLMMVHEPGSAVDSVVATYVVTRPEERMARLAVVPDIERHQNMLDIALWNGHSVTSAFFEQDGDTPHISPPPPPSPPTDHGHADANADADAVVYAHTRTHATHVFSHMYSNNEIPARASLDW